MRLPRVLATALLAGALLFDLLLLFGRIQRQGDPLTPLHPPGTNVLAALAGVALLAAVAWPSRLDRFRVHAAGVAVGALAVAGFLLKDAAPDGQPYAFVHAVVASVLALLAAVALALRERSESRARSPSGSRA